MSARSPLLSARAASPRQSQGNTGRHLLLPRSEKLSRIGSVVAASVLILTVFVFLVTYALVWTQNRDLLKQVHSLQNRVVPWHVQHGLPKANDSSPLQPTTSMRVDSIGANTSQWPSPEQFIVELPVAEVDVNTTSLDAVRLAEDALVDYWVSGVDGSFPVLEPEELSAYYSIGKTEPFIGDIMLPGVAEEAFRKCSYKKEVIMMCTDVGDIWLEFVFSQILMMRDRGYAHVIVYMDSKDHCERFQKFMPDVCCVYSSVFELNPEVSNFWTPLGRLWTMRWLLFSQALRAGYNMLHVDNDVMFTTDIYRYLKGEVFSKYNLIALSSPALIGINCGTVYAQNAHPQGPTAWAAFQVPDRTLRWLDDQNFILKLLNSTDSPGKLQDIGFEQSVFNDAVWAIVSGKPFFQHSMRPTNDDQKEKEAWEDYHKRIGPDNSKKVAVEVPESWAPIIRQEFNNTSRNIELTYYDTQLVFTGSDRDERLGLWPFPEKRGQLSTALLGAISSSGLELWPDWEGDSISDQSIHDRRESFLIAPGWLMGAWNKDGNKGYWHVDRPHVVSAHMCGMGGKHQHGKKLGFKVGGWWHYEATKRLYGDGIFFSSTEDHPFPRLLVIDPSIQLNAASTAEMKGLHLGLILAGYLSDRVWVWPHVDCASKRFSHDHSFEIWTGTKDTNALYYGGPNNLKCIDLELTWNYCMEKGMSQPDFEYYRTLEPELTRKTDQNTIHITGELVSSVTKETAEDATKVTSIDVEDLQTALNGMADQRVVYVSAPFALAQGDKAGWHPGTCVPHCDYNKMKPGLVDELLKFESIQGCYPFVKMLVDRSEL